MSDPKIEPKKNEQIRKMVQTIQDVKSHHSVAAAPLVAAAGLSASSYKRWKRRIDRGDEPVQKPGVKKIAAIDLEKLRQQIVELPHGNKRTGGTVSLYRENNHGISRRQFNEMVRQVRASHNRSKSASICLVRWLYPDVAWALDGLQLSPGMQKCTKNGNEKCTTSRKPVMVTSSFRGGDSHDFMGAIHGHFGITPARVEFA